MKIHAKGFYKLLSGFGSATIFLLSAGNPVCAAEWGYENEVPPPTGMSAGPALSLTGAKAKKDLQVPTAKSAAAALKTSDSASENSKPGAPQVKSSAAAGSAGKRLQARALPPNAKPLDRNSQAIEYWLKLYAFASDLDLDREVKEKARQYLKSCLESEKASQVTGILEFWPRVESAAAASPEQKEHYKTLLRALLRVEAGKASAAGSGEQEIISAVLGPVRIAAQGTPPLTEDATEAYANMACFLYEQSHPDKTVNATDNRLVFASVIRTKYIEAPTQKDREAVANFDLIWARFKILWTGADEQGRQKLLAQWNHKDATARGAQVSDPTLDAVLHKGPWNELK